MYFLFRYHNIMPMQYYNMGPGERKTVKAFLNYEMEKRSEEIEEIQEAIERG